jgi:dUTP pyrophosphatase
VTDLPFVPLTAEAQLPEPAHDGDAGLDLRSVEDVVLAPGARHAVRVGLAVAIPRGHAGLVVPRSGLALRHGVTVLNGPGLIDPGYRGELRVPLLNTDRDEPFAIAVGDRIAQLVVVAVAPVRPRLTAELPDSSRGTAGFGSSGVR